MSMDNKQIIEATKNLPALVDLIHSVDSIAIIEYNGKDINGCKALYEFISEQELDECIVKRVVLLGKRCREIRKNKESVEELFPNCEVTIPGSVWSKVEAKELNVRNTLVLHMTYSTGITIESLQMAIGPKIFVNRLIRETKFAFSACYISVNETIKIIGDFSLSKYTFTEQQSTPQTAYCKEKQEYMDMCLNNLSKKDAFFQFIDEVEHGCDKCNQCSNYGSRKQCPIAQRRVAECYREGIYVPKDVQIAHQWERMASKQGYNPATLQIAEDLRYGKGCTQDVNAALNTLLSFASIRGYEKCAREIIDIVEDNSDIDPVTAVPSLARLANDGDGDMILKLCNAYLVGSFGLPKDNERHKNWMEKGAENGSLDLLESMAKMYEEKEMWDLAYSCYEELDKNDVFVDYSDKLYEIENKVVDNETDAQTLAEKGLNLYRGYDVVENQRLAYLCFSKSAELGNSLGEYGLSLCYKKGKGIAKDETIGKEWENKAADHGDIIAMLYRCLDYHKQIENEEMSSSYYQDYLEKFKETLNMYIEEQNLRALITKGKLLEYGDLSFEQNYVAAMDCYMKAAELGDISALNEIGDFYYDGLGVEKDYCKAFQWYEKAAKRGNLNGIYSLGLAYYLGEGVQKNGKAAFEWLKKATKRKHSYAMYYTAECYRQGFGTAKDTDKAYQLYEEAANGDCELAMLKLCSDYFNGTHYNKDYQQSAYWGEKALEKGEKSVRFEVAYSSKELGNIDRARELYTILADEEDNVAAMNNLGCLETDTTLKADWFKKAADKGSRVAQLNIGRFYKNGTGVEKDYSIAMDYLIKSADQDYPEAMHEIAMMYKNKQGIDEEEYPEKMIEWLTKAAEKGFKPSMMELASLYKNGTIIDQDYQLALKYYMKVAEIDKTDDNQKDDSNKTKALYEIGTFYEYGYGVMINIHKAVYWYRKAANKNNWQAKEALRRLDSNWIDEQGNATDKTNVTDDLPF